MKNKYFNDAILGNGKILVSFSKFGELLRFYYPNIDFKQHIDEFKVGFVSDLSPTVWLDEDINNEYNQYFEENTNILNTEVYNSYFKIIVEQKDFVCINKNILLKKYRIKNRSDKTQNIKILVYSKILKDLNNYTSGYFKDNVLIQYNHDYSLKIAVNKPVTSYQINGSSESKDSGNVDGKDYIGMSNDSSIICDLGSIMPNEVKEIVLSLEVSEDINNLFNSNYDYEVEYNNAKEYWKNYELSHKKFELKNKKIEEIYTRTLLLFPLLSNKETGGIEAGVEIDENMTRCGRYSYCWMRDSIFINAALEICKMEDTVDKFYNCFAKKTQSINGSWEQRFYTDGKLAPSWGYQIDETASYVYGVWHHFEKTRDIAFLIDNLSALEKAIDCIESYLNNRNTVQKSYDLWEEREGLHCYSLACICCAFKCMEAIYKRIDNCTIDEEKHVLQIEKCQKLALETKNLIYELFFDDEYIKRNNLDDALDISILGLCVPFDVIDAEDEKLKNTVNLFEEKLKNQFGGIMRYENDGYSNDNAWPIATLWLSLYYIKIGNLEKAKEYFDFVVETSCKHGYLAEQICGNTNKPAWVIGLGWSHAMFILVLEKLYGKVIE